MSRPTGALRVLVTGAATGLRSCGFGRIVNVGSIHSLVASPFKSAYVAAKHGLIGFAKTVALETADTDITINTICPSYVRTGFPSSASSTRSCCGQWIAVDGGWTSQ